jgi:hypothetical protein
MNTLETGAIILCFNRQGQRSEFPGNRPLTLRCLIWFLKDKSS